MQKKVLIICVFFMRIIVKKISKKMWFILGRGFIDANAKNYCFEVVLDTDCAGIDLDDFCFLHLAAE